MRCPDFLCEIVNFLPEVAKNERQWRSQMKNPIPPKLSALQSLLLQMQIAWICNDAVKVFE